MTSSKQSFLSCAHSPHFRNHAFIFRIIKYIWKVFIWMGWWGQWQQWVLGQDYILEIWNYELSPCDSVNFIKLCVFRDLTDKAWASGSGYCVFRSHLGSHRARVLYILVEQERTVLIWHLQMSHLQMITNTLLDLQAKESFSVRKVKDLTEKTVCTLCPHLMTTVQPVLVFTPHS